MPSSRHQKAHYCTCGCPHCMSSNACTHLRICLIQTHRCTWSLVRQKQVIKKQDLTLGHQRNQKYTVFSVGDYVKFSLRRANVSGKLYQAPRKLFHTVYIKNVQKELRELSSQSSKTRNGAMGDR